MNAAFNIKSQRLDALNIKLATSNTNEIQQLLQHQQDKYKKFNKLPAILDINTFKLEESHHLTEIISLFCQAGLNIYALSHSDEQWETLAQELKLAFLKPKNEAEKQEENEHTPPAESTPDNATSSTVSTQNDTIVTLPARKTYVVNTPVRTGQQVYAEHADLIVLGMVSEGAEVIADGNIHIYAPMRGRALAGASGDIHARIFIQSMQAELVSIAGIYRVFERQLPEHLHRQAVQVELIEDRLSLSAIQAE